MNILFNIKKNKLEYVKNENIMKSLYYMRYSVPNEKTVKDCLKGNNKKDKNIADFFGKAIPKKIQLIKDEISKIDNFIPLYDIYRENLYIIDKSIVYDRVIYNHYRFLTEDVINDFKNELIEKRTNFEKKLDIATVDVNLEKIQNIQIGTLDKRKYYILKLMVDFLDYFNIDILFTTYTKVFYLHANKVGKEITFCIRPSFLPQYRHISPYYSRSELINLGLNMGIIKENDTYYDQDKLSKICKIIKKNDISSEIILSHQRHCLNENKIGVVQYYTLQGSYFMNQYLRGLAVYDERNILLEKIIKSMWDLIRNAPKFTKSYIVYRFIKDDDYLQNLRIGDVFVNPSFISTTRDPFYKSEDYRFGFILIKIIIPKDVKGVGLCVESYSHFPEEQEIVLPPLTKLKLLKKDSDCQYFHIDHNYKSKILTRYEFELLGNNEITFEKRTQIKESEKLIDFMKMPAMENISIDEKIKLFCNDHIDSTFQFFTIIGDKKIKVITEWYDSTTIYKKFYANITNNGFSMYTIYNSNVLFFIELGENTDGENVMYVNFYFQHSTQNRKKIITDEHFIEFVAKVGYYFEIGKILIYADYQYCLSGSNKYNIGGNYCIDIYEYLKNKKKRFSELDSLEIKSGYSFYDLDTTKRIPLDKILKESDRDEIYQIYRRVYSELYDKSKHNLKDFYVWMVETNCFLTQILVEKTKRVFSKNNPFMTDYYVLDPVMYLYNKNIIGELTIFQKAKYKNVKLRQQGENKNRYRLNLNRRARIPTIN